MSTLNKLITNLSASFEASHSLLSEVLSPVADELDTAQLAVSAVIDQLATTTADDEWLDEWGSYFNVPRLTGEQDAAYGRRIIIEILQPKENNIAIAKAIKNAFGQEATVADVVMWDNVVSSHNGGRNFNGIITYSDSATARYGLFEIVSSYNLEGGTDVVEYAAMLRAFVDRFRAAGTQLRTLALGGSYFDDGAFIPSDAASLIIAYITRHNGAHSYSGALLFSGERYVIDALS